jgi:SAM-dependent methyltransferase
MDSINYYNKNAEVFINGTIDVDMSELRNRFLKYIPKKGTILDLGCGAGRDAKAFMTMGYDVYAVDGSVEMVKSCGQYIGTRAVCATFEEYETTVKFDGIWASASLLHVEEDKIVTVISKYVKMLKINGAFYMSFKYGDENYVKADRFFNCYKEDSLNKMLGGVKGIEVVEKFLTGDVRDGRSGEKWVNVIGRRRSLDM